MTTAALAKIKSPQALSWDTLAEVCRLCLRNECIKFDIFDDTTSSETETIYQRISRFYDVKVANSDRLPTKICHDCLFQMEIHSEFRNCVLQNEQRLREFAHDLFPKDAPADPPEDDLSAAEQSDGESIEFTEQEKRTATVIDPDQVYDSDDLEGNDMDEDDDDADEPGQMSIVEDETILLSDDDEDEDGEEEEDEDHLNQYIPEPTPTLPFSILAQQLNHGLPRPDPLKTFFLCHYCDLGFKFQENCTEHELTKHDAAMPYNCIFCIFCSDNRLLLQQHFKEAHKILKPFICTECKKGFTRRSDLRKHTIVHTGVRPFTCQICHKSFSRNTNLTKHMRIHSGQKPFVCPKCPRTFVTKTDLVRHQRTHDGVKPFECSVCPSSFSRRDKLINHQNMHIRRGHLNGAMVEGMALPNYTSNAGMTPSPAAATSSSSMNIPGVNPPAAPLLPPSTAISTPDGSHSQHHQGGSSGGGAGMVIDLDPLTEMRPANGMDMSQRILEAALMQGSLALTTPNHFGSLTMSLPEQLFATPTTGSGGHGGGSSSSLGSSEFNSHQLAGATTNRPYVCPECGKGFPRKGELERHETVHTGAKPFGCPMCEKRFSRKDKLVRHKRTHLLPPALSNGGGIVTGDSGPFNGMSGDGVGGAYGNAQSLLRKPELPQISFTAALENFRRTEMEFLTTQAPSGAATTVVAPSAMVAAPGGGGPAAGGMVQQQMVAGAGNAPAVVLEEPKDYSYKPNFYSQIDIGDQQSTATTTMSMGQ